MKGRPTNEVRNLRRFTEQWEEFADQEFLKFGNDDVKYVAQSLFDDPGLDKYNDLADALEA